MTITAQQILDLKTSSTRNKRVLLVAPEENDGKPYEHFPSGALILLGSLLHARGHSVRLVHMTADHVNVDGLQAVVERFVPDLVGLTMNTYQTRSVREVSAALKRRNAALPIIVGGPHVSALREHIFKFFPHVDYAVCGEGEQALLELLAGVPPDQIPGLCRPGQSQVVRSTLPDLDFIPLPRLDLIKLARFPGADPHRAYPQMFIMASRGCPFQCTFCNKSVFGHGVRFRRPELIVREVEWLYSEYGIREIFFQDDTFNLKRDWAEHVMQLLIDRKLSRKLAFATSFRANRNLVDADLLRMAKAAGFWLIFYGVENGNQAMLNAMGKGLTLEEIRRAFRLTHAAGLETKASFMIGMPGETENTVEESIRLWRELDPLAAGVGPAIPFPDTEFDHTVTASGHKLSEDFDLFSSEAVLIRTAQMDADCIRLALVRFRKVVLKKAMRDLFHWPRGVILLRSLLNPRYLFHVVRRMVRYLVVERIGQNQVARTASAKHQP